MSFVQHLPLRPLPPALVIAPVSGTLLSLLSPVQHRYSLYFEFVLLCAVVSVLTLCREAG